MFSKNRFFIFLCQTADGFLHARPHTLKKKNRKCCKISAVKSSLMILPEGMFQCSKIMFPLYNWLLACDSRKSECEFLEITPRTCMRKKLFFLWICFLPKMLKLDCKSSEYMLLTTSDNSWFSHSRKFLSDFLFKVCHLLDCHTWNQFQETN